APGKTQGAGNPAQQQSHARAGPPQGIEQRHPAQPSAPEQLIVQPGHTEHQTAECGQQQTQQQRSVPSLQSVDQGRLRWQGGTGGQHGSALRYGLSPMLARQAAAANTLSERIATPATVTPRAAMLGLVSDRRGITHHAPLVDRNPDQPAGPAQYPDRDRPDDGACGAQGSDSPPGF